MKVNINTSLWLSRIGLGLIFGYCFLVSIFISGFAQLHLSLSFLPFPIFIGEILMFICIPLLVWVCKDTQIFDQRTMLLLGFYFTWVVVKALINYYYDGPLSFRNAALFYYPVFAVFAYGFYQKAGNLRNILMLLGLMVMGILFFKVMNVWYWWTYISLLVIAVLNMKSALWRCLACVFLAVIFLLGKEYFYQGPRAHFVSIFVSVIFLISFLGALCVKRHEFARLGILLLVLLFFISGYFMFSERNAISSLTSLKRTIKTYNEWDKKYRSSQGNFVSQKLAVHLYNPKKLSSFMPFSSNTPCSSVVSATPQGKDKCRLQHSLKHVISNEVLRNHAKEGHSLELDENNIVFRLFVWRDMAEELIDKKAWWGFSFGHPQRSKSLEALGWAQSEWKRDGWITPHNSFFHIIYRAGLLGIFLIGVLFFMIGRMIRDFFNLDSIVGSFLVGVLVYWLALSNFFVILEFPYDAVVFWTLFGITCAYRDGLKVKVIH